MARVRYEHSYAGAGELLRSDFMLAEMKRRADLIEDVAIAIAPVDSGDYIESFRVHSTRRGGPNADRAQARVENVSDHAFYVEFGTSRQRGQHVLLTAAFAAGGG
jgi:hypothetical protein